MCARLTGRHQLGRLTVGAENHVSHFFFFPYPRTATANPPYVACNWDAPSSASQPFPERLTPFLPHPLLHRHCARPLSGPSVRHVMHSPSTSITLPPVTRLPQHPYRSFTTAIFSFALFASFLSSLRTAHAAEFNIDPASNLVQKVSVPFNNNKTFSVNLNFVKSKNPALLVQFLVQVNLSNSNDLGKLVEEGYPDLLLYASKKDPLDLHNTSSQACNQSCSTFYPCFKNEQDIYIDRFAFYSHFQSAFIRIDDLQRENSTFHIGVLNYDRARKSTSATPLTPTLDGTLYIRLVDDEDKKCPVNLQSDIPENNGDPPDVCSKRGTCVGKRCNCIQRGKDPPFVGLICEQPVYEYGNDTNPFNDASEGLSIQCEYETHYSWCNVTVGSFKTAVIRFPALKEKRMFWRIYPHINGYRLDERNETSAQLFTSSQRKENKCYPDLTLSDLPRWLGEEVRFNVSYNSYNDRYSSADGGNIFPSKPPTQLTLAIFANATDVPFDELKNAQVDFATLQCEKREDCGKRLLIIVPYALLPVSLAIMLLAAFSIIVMLWLDRRHGFTSKVDKLSVNELQRMYPVVRYVDNRRRDGVVDEDAEESGNEAICSICICHFEEMEDLRKLNCGHMFHTECLDVS